MENGYFNIANEYLLFHMKCEKIYTNLYTNAMSPNIQHLNHRLFYHGTSLGINLSPSYFVAQLLCRPTAGFIHKQPWTQCKKLPRSHVYWGFLVVSCHPVNSATRVVWYHSINLIYSETAAKSQYFEVGEIFVNMNCYFITRTNTPETYSLSVSTQKRS